MRSIVRIVAAGAAAVLLPAAAYAQVALAGTVKDASGAVLPGVTVEAASPVLIEKARTAALARCESAMLEERINTGRIALLSSPLSGILEGGVPIVIEGEVVGAVGVSGVKPDQDAQVARAGAAAAITNA